MRKQKHAKYDFGIEQLPHNRKEVFADCVNVQFGSLCRLGFLLLLFALPLILVRLFTGFAVAGFVAQDGMTAEQVEYVKQYTIVFGKLLSIPAWAILGVGVGGIIRVIRQLAWGQNLFFRQDFWDGIKLNWKSTLPIFLLYGALSLVSSFCKMTFGSNLLGYLPLGINVAFFVPILLWMVSQSAIYNVKFGKNFYNAFCLYCKALPVTLLATIGAFVVYFETLIPWLLVQIVVVVLTIILLLPMGILGWFLYCNSVFDEHINKQNYPEIVGKGIYPTDKAE